MARLIAALIIAMLPINSAQPALAEPTSGNGFGAHLENDSAETWRRLYVPADSSTRRARRSQQHILTAYRAVCAENNSTTTTSDTCHRATTLCPPTTDGTPRTAAWIMTAPAQPPPTTTTWTNTGRITCTTTTDPTTTPRLTTTDFRRLPIPAPTITTQPPPTRPALINTPLNLYTHHTTPLLNTTLLNQPLRVRATPTHYTWNYGDGHTRTTTTPGGPYPNLTTAHTYHHPGTYTVTLTTTYTGEYATPTGPWQPINGTATITSPPITLTTTTATTRLTT